MWVAACDRPPEKEGRRRRRRGRKQRKGNRMKTDKKNWMAALAAAAAMAAAAAVAAEEEDAAAWWRPEVTVGADVASQQMTYGIVDNADPIVTLSGSVAWQAFSFGVEGIFDTTDWGETDGGYGDREWKWQELDLTPALSWTFEEGLPTPVEAGLSYSWQHHPDAKDEEGNDANPDTQVIGFSLGLPELPLSPALGAEWDVDDENGAVYAMLEVSHAFELVAGAEEGDDPALALELGAGLGMGNAKRNDCDAGWDHASLKDVQLSAALPWKAGRLTVSPYVLCTEQVEHALRRAAEESDPDGHSFQGVAGVSVEAAF